MICFEVLSVHTHEQHSTVCSAALTEGTIFGSIAAAPAHMHGEQQAIMQPGSHAHRRRHTSTCVICRRAAAGANQLAGVGVALSVFNTTTKLFNVPLLSVTTSSVAAAAGRAAAEAKAAAAAGNSSSSAAAAAAAAGVSSAISSSTLIAAGVGLVQVGPAAVDVIQTCT
jgi:hypothetical protein